MMRKTLTVLLLALPFAAGAEWGEFDQDFDTEKPWGELQAQLPAYPKSENLLPFDAGHPTSNRYFVDAASISVGADGVVRYTLVVKSLAGAMNVSFEGIRCETRERKVYAFGRSDNTWSRARASKWETIETTAQHMHQVVLYKDFFCPGLIIVKTPEEAVQALKRGVHPRAVNY